MMDRSSLTSRDMALDEEAKLRLKAAKRTVLYVDDAVSFGGSLIVTSLLIKHLDRDRYRAVVVGEAEESVLRFLFDGRAVIYRIPRAFSYLDWHRMQQWLPERAPVMLRKAWSYLLSVLRGVANVPYYVRLARVMARERVDLVHDSNGNPQVLAMVLGRPVVSTMAGIPRWRRFSNFVRTRFYARHERAIMISEIVRDHFVRAGGPAEIAEVIPNPTEPIDLPDGLRLELCQRYRIPESSKVFGIVGRVVPWKGQKEFLAAAKKVLAAVPDSVAIIVGDGADGGPGYYDEVRSLASESEFADRIRFTGYVEKVNEIYALLDVAVHASIEPEPFGLVIIEAMGHGVPIVAASSGAAPEIVEPGVDGLLTDPVDTRSLASAIVRLLDDDELRRAMGERGRQKVEARYHARSYAKSVQAIYDEVFS